MPNFVATVVGEDWASALAPFGEPPAGSAAEVEARWSWWCVIFALEAPFKVREGVALARPEPWRSELSDYQPTADYLWAQARIEDLIEPPTWRFVGRALVIDNRWSEPASPDQSPQWRDSVDQQLRALPRDALITRISYRPPSRESTQRD